MVDLLIDPAAGVGGAGSSWSVAIANLFAVGPAFGTLETGVHYYFPLYLKAGTAIGTAHQNSTAGTLALRVSIRVFGKPSRPDLIKYGTLIQTINANTAATDGTVLTTPGTSVMGSYSATLGTLTRDTWWTDTTQVNTTYLWDVAANATNKILCMENVQHHGNTSEQNSKAAFGTRSPYCFITSGQDVYTRAACVTAPDSSLFGIVYAMGG
jgi:hypothetical protein